MCCLHSEEEAARAYDIAAIRHRGKRVRRALLTIHAPIYHVHAKKTCLVDRPLQSAVQAVTNFEARLYSREQLGAGAAAPKPSSAGSVTGAGSLYASRLACASVHPLVLYGHAAMCAMLLQAARTRAARGQEQQQQAARRPTPSQPSSCTRGPPAGRTRTRCREGGTGTPPRSCGSPAGSLSSCLGQT